MGKRKDKVKLDDLSKFYQDEMDGLTDEEKADYMDGLAWDEEWELGGNQLNAEEEIEQDSEMEGIYIPPASRAEILAEQVREKIGELLVQQHVRTGICPGKDDPLEILWDQLGDCIILARKIQGVI